MQILIPDSWLREFLQTSAKSKDIARCLSLCGPTVDRTRKVGDDYVYDIEVTTNRVDAMSVYGIAREAAAILPQFGFKAKLKKNKVQKPKNKGDLGVEIRDNPSLCHRILAIKLKNVKLAPSPKWLQDRLIKVGQRPLINAIDITNYVMWEIGHPCHVFDYDRITEKKIIVREARKGEQLVTLDNKTLILNGGEVVFGNGKGEIIDLPGIMGTKNTVVTPKTKNVLLWIESVDPIKIRKASMALGIRSQAAILNEKGVDPELGLPSIERGIELFEKLCGAKIACKLVDLYPKKPKIKPVKVEKAFIDERLGVDISKKEIKKYLTTLEFTAFWQGNILNAKPPTFRCNDIQIPEDIVEEIARIYGYYKLPSNLMSAALPKKPQNSPFKLENVLRNSLKNLGGCEVYTLSLVPKEWAGKNAFKLKNPLGSDSEYLRTTLMHSLNDAANQNSGEAEPFHLFEIANIYSPRKNKLPKEKMILAGIFTNTKYRDAKGVIEALLSKLNIKVRFNQVDKKYFKPAQRLEISSGDNLIGQLGILENGKTYYEFEVDLLRKSYRQYPKYKSLPKYPAQIEDITFTLPDKTRVGEVIRSIKSSDKLVVNCELVDIYKNAFTFRVHYQHPNKTLKDKEVEKIRLCLIKLAKNKYGAVVKD